MTTRRLLLALLLSAALLPACAADAPRDLLQFLDGSALHGALHSIDPKSGVRWQHADAARPIDFIPRNLHVVKLAHARPAATNAPAACHFRFANDDELFGNLLALDEETVTIETWFAGRLGAPRATLRSVTFMHNSLATLYEGPAKIEEWKVGPAPDVWRTQEGALVATGFGFCGRDMKLGAASRTEFDLAWSGQLNLIVSIYSDTIDRFDWLSSSYQFNFNSSFVNLMRGQGQAGMGFLGQTQIPAMMQKNKVRLTFLVSREPASLTLLADGVPVQTWRDPAGFAGKGSGLLFYSQRQGPTIRISDLRVSAWDGRLDSSPAETNVITETTIKLVNNDQISGTVESVRDGKVSVVSGVTKLSIPLARVTQIQMAGAAPDKRAAMPGELRAQFFGGESLSLLVKNWDSQQAAGISPNFGPLKLQPAWVRQIQFNPGPVKSTGDFGFSESDPFLPIE